MFKELKVIKLLIVVSLLAGIIFKMDFADIAIQELYTDKASYLPGDTVKIFSSSNILKPISLNIDINDISGNKVSSTKLHLQTQQVVKKNTLQYGLAYEKHSLFIIPTNFKSGIYLINNKFPLIVKSKDKADITIVYPYMNNILYQTVNNKNVFSNNTPIASFLRTCFVDKYTEGMTKLFSHLNTKYKVNYITDIDLELNKNSNNSNLLIIYGKSTCWTPKMVESYTEFQNNGGNLLNITSYLANNICWSNKENEIKLVGPNMKYQSWYSYNYKMPHSLVGTSYSFSGYSNKKEYSIQNKKHPIFYGINQNKIKVDGNLFVAPPTEWNGTEPRIHLNRLDYYDGEILAFSKANYNNFIGTKGIFLLQPKKTSGKIISLGTEDWCLQKNIGEKEELQIITKNTIDYLLQQ